MQTVDYNWQALKEEDRTLPEKQPHKMIDAADIQIVQWNNNPYKQKLTWKESMAPYTAWIDKGDTKGMWRPIENRLYEEIQADCALNRFGQGYKIIRSTPRFEDGTNMLNAKVIEIQKEGVITEMILILDSHRVFVGKQGKIKEGMRWTFNTSVSIKELV